MKKTIIENGKEHIVYFDFECDQKKNGNMSNYELLEYILKESAQVIKLKKSSWFERKILKHKEYMCLLVELMGPWFTRCTQPSLADKGIRITLYYYFGDQNSLSPWSDDEQRARRDEDVSQLEKYFVDLVYEKQIDNVVERTTDPAKIA